MRQLLFIILTLLLASCVNNSEPSGAEVSVGDSLPQFQVMMNDGTLVSDASLRGKKALIVFFNTGCPDCRSELPVVERFHVSQSDVRVVCISREEDANSVSAYWQKENFTMPYSAQADRKVYSLFASSRIPRLYLVDGSGVILAMWDDRNSPSLQELMQ